MKPKLFLIHGLFMNSYIMHYMERHLGKRGYDVHNYSYHSVKRDFKDNAKLLVDFIVSNSKPGDTCHFVGHSLGGLLIRQAYEISPDVFSGSVVTIGTPHNGSEVARRVANDLHKMILGGAFDGALDGGLPEWSGLSPLGSIAGDRCIGIGNILNGLEKPNDGTVSVSETQLKGQTDHVILPLSHTALVYSSRVIEQVDYFLQNKCFMHLKKA